MIDDMVFVSKTVPRGSFRKRRMVSAPSWCVLCVSVLCSASTSNVAKLEEMERLLREAQIEKRSLLEHKVSTKWNHNHSDLSFFSHCFHSLLTEQMYKTMTDVMNP